MCNALLVRLEFSKSIQGYKDMRVFLQLLFATYSFQLLALHSFDVTRTHMHKKHVELYLQRKTEVHGEKPVPV
jgi:hypothetical protein